VSSNTFSSNLIPDPQLRRLVLGTGAGAALGGVAAIVELPLEWPWRAAAIGFWMLVCGRDLWLITAGYKHCARIRIEHTGNMLVFASDDCSSVATIGAGSIVLWNFAWLRFRSESGRRHVELIRRKTAQDKDWRRLQVIWRHLGAGA